MLTVNRYSEKTYEKSGVRPVAKTKENVAKNNVFTAVFRAQENTRWTSSFSGVHRRKTPNSPDVFRRAENGWQIANFPKIPLLVKLPVNEGFLAVVLDAKKELRAGSYSFCWRWYDIQQRSAQVGEFFGHKYAVTDLLKIHKEHLMTIKC